MTNPQEELSPIEDKIQQIFKFLEIADVSQWQGMNVFEAGDADSLYGILKTALGQALEQGREEARKVIGGEISWLMDTYNYEDHEVKESGQVEILQKVDEKIVTLSKLRKEI